MSPAPALRTKRTVTIGRSCLSTKSTGMPFFSLNDSIFGGVKVTGGPGSGT